MEKRNQPPKLKQTKWKGQLFILWETKHSTREMKYKDDKQQSYIKKMMSKAAKARARTQTTKEPKKQIALSHVTGQKKVPEEVLKYPMLTWIITISRVNPLVSTIMTKLYTAKSHSSHQVVHTSIPEYCNACVECDISWYLIHLPSHNICLCTRIYFQEQQLEAKGATIRVFRLELKWPVTFEFQMHDWNIDFLTRK